MQLTRRGFVKATTASIAASSLGGLFAHSKTALAAEEKQYKYRLDGATETSTICPYCAVGCGALCAAKDGELINLEGDPDNPLNLGGMCSKGISQFGLRNIVDKKSGKVIANDSRVEKVLRRAPGSDTWEEVSWEDAIKAVSEKVRDVRNDTFEKFNKDGVLVNRTDAIGWLGGAALDNEELALSTKLARALGLVYVEHQARI